MNNYTLAIIGGGAGAFAAAIHANQLKAKTLMINAGLPLGGTCVNVGCVPSKTLIHAAELLYAAKRHGVPGITLAVKGFDFKKVVSDERALVERMRKEKYVKVLKHLSHVTYLKGRAVFVSPHTLEVNGKQFSADKIIIAAGSTAMVPDINGIREAGYVTHSEALRLTKQPKKLIVIGGGPVGLEFAQLYARFGTTVTILQRGKSIFRRTEPELAQRLAEVLTGEGIAIRTGATIHSVRRRNGKKVVSYSLKSKRYQVAADELLLAAGKTPNTAGLGLERAGVATDERRAIVVNKHFQTAQPNVFAVGDITNLPLRLETTAGYEGTLAVENALTGSKKSIDYNTVPYTIFTDPQLAGVGFTEDAQMKAMGVCACRTVSFADVPKAVIMNRTEGLIKMAIHPKTKRILGIHILAPQAGDLIAEAMMIVKNKNTIDDVTSSLPVFPTLSEAIKLVARSFTQDISKLSCCI